MGRRAKKYKSEKIKHKDEIRFTAKNLLCFLFYDRKKGGWEMDNRVWVKDAVMTIRLPEEVDHFVADRLREEAGEILVERNVREVVFDFRKTVFMDSSGIGLVMGRFREMELIGGKVRAVHVGERMRRILVMSGVTRVIEVEEEKTWK